MEITVTWGGDPVEIEATRINGYFCIHRSITKIEPESYKVLEMQVNRNVPTFSKRLWTVTHIPSGLSVGKFRTKRLGMECVEELMTTDVKWQHETTDQIRFRSTKEAWLESANVVSRYRA